MQMEPRRCEDRRDQSVSLRVRYWWLNPLQVPCHREKSLGGRVSRWSEILAGVTAREAAARPLNHTHSIWEIVVHIITWEGAVRRRLEGEAVEPSPEEDWPPVTDTRDMAWQRALEALKKGHMALREEVSRLAESRLKDIAPGIKYSIYFMLHGVIQHDLYHAGQIALLKKAAQ